jgi:predicted RNase H-like HicB family nuclease
MKQLQRLLGAMIVAATRFSLASPGPELDHSARSRHPPVMRRKGRNFNVVIERNRDGYYVGSVPELRGCHTQAKSQDVLLKRTREVIDLCLEVESPPVDSPEFIGVQRVLI